MKSIAVRALNAEDSMNILMEKGITSDVQRYNMTLGSSVQKVSDHVGEVIDVQAWAIFEDQKADGTTARVVSILTTDGDVLASSGYSERSFEDILSCFKTSLPRLAIKARKSRGGRSFCFFEPVE